LKSGLDAVLWFGNIERKECFRRAIGRRYDPLNDKIYHIEDGPPQTSSAPLCERLIRMGEKQKGDPTELINNHNICDKKGDEGLIVDKCLAFD